MAVFQKNKHKRVYSAPFPVLAAVLSLLFLVLSIGAVTYFLSVAAERENNVAYRESRHIVETAFSLKERDLKNWARDYAWWDDTRNFATLNVDIKWAENNIGTYLQDSFGVTGSFVVTPDLQTIFYSPRTGNVLNNAQDFIGAGGTMFLRTVQATAMDSSIALTRYVRSGDRLYLIGAAPITKEQPSGDDLIRRPRPILVIYKELDSAVVAEMSGQFLLNDLRIASAPIKNAASFALQNDKEPPVAFASWLPSTPGDELFSELLPKLSLVSIMLFTTALLIFFLWWRTASQANIEKSRFLAKMSHELRTPLNPIVGFSSMMVNETLGPIPDLYKNYATDIHRCGMHLSGVIQDILDVSRIEAGEMALSETEFDIAPLIDEVPAFIGTPFSGNAGQSAMPKISSEVPDGIPKLRADRLRVQQVLLNLISNAVKFSAGKEILIRATLDNGCVLISVEDKGIGISEHDLKLLFQPFVQVGQQSIENRSHGSGLGLVVSRELMRLHGGDLLLHSKLGEGTTAIMQFPASRSVP
ncbi:MAG: hypothetical protein JJ855_11570 [Rhodospirillales bacterium]|nr:hypothetical protein [Rhodospirillales bacterium]